MKLLITLFLGVVLVFFGIQTYDLYRDRSDLEDKIIDLTAQAGAITSENKKFGNDIEYFKNDYNLAKELQARFNYHDPDEQMFMLVPAVNATTTR